MKTHLNNTRGFSLVELMIALVLGVVVIGGSVSIFTGVIRSSNLNQAVSNLQSNGRFVMDLIGRDIRAAGHVGCVSQQAATFNVGVNNPPVSSLTDSSISGYVVGETTWSPSLPLSYTAPTGVGKPVAGTHALSIQYASSPGLFLDSSMASRSADIVAKKNAAVSLSQGDLMVVSDCSSVDLMSINSISTTGTKTTITPNAALTKNYATSTMFPESTQVMPYVSVIYYIGDTQRTTQSGKKVLGLFSHNFPYTAANPPVELIDGVDQLVVQFGIRKNDGSLYYLKPGDSGYSAAAVETVRLGVLLTSFERFSEVDESRAFTLAGLSVTALAGSTTATGSATSLTYASDKRMRMPFNATLHVRNRSL